jgi:ubiquinone/menaquinone biosynthesis C-methylase UbiE
MSQSFTPRTESSWPKKVSPLSAEQQRISDDFMRYWLEVLPRHYGFVERFNHGYVLDHSPRDFVRTLEIGAGLGEHLLHEKLTPAQEKNYVAMDVRDNLLQKLGERFPKVQTHLGDCQGQLAFSDEYFDRILAIHVLEHLPNLPAAIKEMHRLCDKTRGVFLVVIPCEGSFPYTIARRLSAQRLFEKRYRQSYRWFIEREHINRPYEIRSELERFFTITNQSYFPVSLPFVFCNLIIGLMLKPKINLNS